MATIDATAPLRPWIASYPEGIVWDVQIDTRPVHEQVLAACARNPSAVALDFLGGTTTFGDLARNLTVAGNASVVPNYRPENSSANNQGTRDLAD